MGRTIVADERVQKCIDHIQTTHEWAIGLLIGQVTEQKDYVVHLVRTPDIEGEEKGSLASVDEGWVSTHARQVLKMLPGGLDIIGVFAIATQDALKTSNAQLRKVLFAVQKMVNKSIAELESIHGDRVLLNICSHTKKVTCRTFNTTNVKSAARPAEWKMQSVLGSWVVLESSVTVDELLPVSVPAVSHTLNKQIQAGLAPFAASLSACLATVQGKLARDDQPVETTAGLAPSTKKGTKGTKAHHSRLHTVNIGLLLDMPDTGLSDVSLTACVAQMRLCGTVSSRAFVHSKATVKEAVQAVKTDVLRSLVARCTLLCEDLLQAEEEQDPRVLYETPVRILGPVSGTPLCFCDYMFQDESPADSIHRFRDLLGLVLNEEDLQLDIEHIPSETDLLHVNQISKPHMHTFRKSSTSSENVRTLIGVVLGATVAVIAAGVSYLYIG